MHTHNSLIFYCVGRSADELPKVIMDFNYNSLGSMEISSHVSVSPSGGLHIGNDSWSITSRWCHRTCEEMWVSPVTAVTAPLSVCLLWNSHSVFFTRNIKDISSHLCATIWADNAELQPTLNATPYRLHHDWLTFWDLSKERSVTIGNRKHPDWTAVNKPLIVPGKHTDVRRTTQSNHVPEPRNAVTCHNNIWHQSLYGCKLQGVE